MVEYGPQPLYFGKYCRIGGSTIRSVQTAKTRWPRALLTRQGRVLAGLEGHGGRSL
jgi:hypothetical protein